MIRRFPRALALCRKTDGLHQHHRAVFEHLPTSRRRYVWWLCVLDRSQQGDFHEEDDSLAAGNTAVAGRHVHVVVR